MSGELGAIAPSSEELSGAELAARAGVGEEEIQRLVTHGVLAPRQGRVAPFRAGDVLKIRVARACEEGGLPMEGIAKAIRAGHLSFAFIESWPFERWAARGPRTHAELATEVGLPFEIPPADRGGLRLRPARARGRDRGGRAPRRRVDRAGH